MATPAGQIMRLVTRRGPILGILEQGSQSAYNFLSILVLSRLLAPDEFGVFALVQAGILFVVGMTGAIWSSPVLVFLPEHREKGRSYLSAVFAATAVTAGALGVVSPIVVRLVGRDLSGLSILGVICWSIAWAQYDVIRRANYVRKKEARTLLAGAALLAGFMYGVLALQWSGLLNTQNAILVNAGAYLVACLVGFEGGSESEKRLKSTGGITKEVVARHWAYSRWIAGGTLFYWVASQGYFVLAAPFVSDTEIGGLRAAQNLVGVASIGILWFENYFTPRAAERYTQGGEASLHDYMAAVSRRVGRPFLIGLLTICPASLFAYEILYAESYGGAIGIVILLTLYQCAIGISRPAAVRLRVRKNTRPFLYAHLASALIAVTLGVLVVWLLGSLGAAIGIMLSGAGLAFALVLSDRRARGHE